ncbi:hypothetical protein SteCoe_12289 [Stentor coeruleus]|uniref:DUF4201 domain-containing protein n=1 Tax=Stentor coeruleus TaxID=5963 RepID=A0A1R2CB51_9CILI|nr:hypothetical protein SteCoe_12289 [Stentor coeruleus]
MGCNATRSVLINNLSSLSESLESEINQLKNTQNQLSSNIKKYTTEENHIGKDLRELKKSLKASMDQASSVTYQIFGLPSFRMDVNDKKESKATIIAETLGDYLSGIEDYNQLILEKKTLKEEKKKISIEISNAKDDLKKCQEDYSENEKFLNNTELYQKQIKVLQMQKVELEQEVTEYDVGARSLLNYSKSKLEDRVAELPEDDARKQLAIVSKRVKGLKEIIEFYKKGNIRDGSLTLGKQDRQDKIAKDYNSVVSLKKEKIKGLRNKLQALRAEVDVIEKMMSSSPEPEDKFGMLSKIIQKCRSPSRKGENQPTSKVVKKRTFLTSVEEVVNKVRVVTINGK